VAEAPEHHNRMAVERMRTRLARAESELEAAENAPPPAQMFLDPRTGDPAERDVVRAVASARKSVSDALETLRLMVGEPDG
jgi:hypothetical protein